MKVISHFNYDFQKLDTPIQIHAGNMSGVNAFPDRSISKEANYMDSRVQ